MCSLIVFLLMVLIALLVNVMHSKQIN